MLKSAQIGLLAVKTQPPKLPTGLIMRERLFIKMDASRSRTLTIIKAAAGFGKSSLAIAWANQLIKEQQRVAWVSLDPEDSEPGKFVQYVTQALHSTCPEIEHSILGLITEISLIRPLDVVYLLLNALVSIEKDIFLFLDDYHVLQDPGISECMSCFLRYAPPQLHVILTTRAEPEPPIVRLRSLNQLVEIDADSLRFNKEEIKCLLEQESLGSTAEAVALQERTEGWPVMIRIIIATSQQSTQDFSSYIRHLSVRNRPICSHLTDMLNGLPEDVVLFLLKTSILENLCKPLCHDVADMAQAGEVFEKIACQQLLLTPIGTDGFWFRCHPLLQDFLLHRLEIEFPDLIPSLHRRALSWYIKEQKWSDAIRHAIAVGDTEQAVKWVEICAIALLRRGELVTISSWEKIFPPELMRRQVKARLAIAWGMALAVRFDEALKLALQIEQDSDDADPNLRNRIRCECQAICAVAFVLADEIDAALPLADASLLSRASGPWTINAASNVALICRWKRGELEHCYSSPWVSFPGDDGAQNVVATVYRRCILGLIEYAQLNQATALCHFKEGLRVARDYAGSKSAAAAQPAVLIAQCLYDQGRLNDAEALILDRLPAIKASCMLECVLYAYTILIRTIIARGDRADTEILLSQASDLAHLRRWSRLEARILRERVYVSLLNGQISTAALYVFRLRHLLDRERDKSRFILNEIRNELEFADALLYIAKKNSDMAISLLHAIKERAIADKNKSLELECSVTKSIALFAEEGGGEFQPDIQVTLEVALSCGRQQMFLDYLLLTPKKVIENFHRAVSASKHSGSVELAHMIGVRLLLYKGKDKKSQCGAVALSPREQNILQLLVEGKSNKEIARDLSVTPETIKTHLKRMFYKLDVSSRSQAVSKYYQCNIDAGGLL